MYFIVYSLELQFKIPFSYEISDQSSFTFGGRQRHGLPYIIMQPCVDAIAIGIAPFKASTGYDEVFYGYLNDQRISCDNCSGMNSVWGSGWQVCRTSESDITRGWIRIGLFGYSGYRRVTS